MHNNQVPCDLVNATKIHFWSDTGPHFRSCEYLHYCLVDFPATLNNGCRVDVNFLTEKHGKNQRDSHFRCVRSYTHRAARSAKKLITTVSDLKDALIRAHHDVQAINKTLKLPIQSCSFYLLNLPVAGTHEKKQLTISDLQCIYALRMEGERLGGIHHQRIRVGSNWTMRYRALLHISKPICPKFILSRIHPF